LTADPRGPVWTNVTAAPVVTTNSSVTLPLRSSDPAIFYRLQSAP
jgi:hypothetical protein